MKTLCIGVLVLGTVLLGPSVGWALWGVTTLTKDSAKKLDVIVRCTDVGKDHVRVDVDIPLNGAFKDVSLLEFRYGHGDNPPLMVPLREERTKDRLAVHFTVVRKDSDQCSVRIMVREGLGGMVYIVSLKDFIVAPKPAP